MQVLQNILIFLANNVFNEVAILIGFITLVGLILQRKRVEEVLAGSLRAAVGIIILFVGVDIFVGGLASFQGIVSSAAGIEPPPVTNTLGDFLGEQGGTIALVITVAFLIHVFAVRIFKTRYVYLTGHLMFWISIVITAILTEIFGALDKWTLVLCGGLIIAAYWTVQPLFIAPLMKKVIGSTDWGLGHTSSSICYIGGKVGSVVGSKEKHDTEKLKLPRQLSFFKDVTVSSALIIMIIIFVSMLFAPAEAIKEQAASYSLDVNPWVWGFITSLRFAAGIAILLFGVRMFLAEIVPAFRGISEKLIPGARPALDIPTVFPYAMTSVMLGFVSATVVFLILMFVFAITGWFALVPPMIMLFFVSGGAAVFGNALGGWRGAVIAGALNGLFLAFGQALTWGMLSNTAPELATLADPDWYIFVWLMKLIAKPFSGLSPGTAVWIVTGIVVLLFGVWLIILKRRGADSELVDTEATISEG